MTPQETVLDCPRELRAYERQRDRIKWEDQGKYAVVRGDELIGLFRTPADACAEGNRRQGQGRFMIKEVGSHEDYLFLGEGPVMEKDLVAVGEVPRTRDQYRVRFVRELAAYEHFRADLEREHMGKTALIYGDQLIGVWADGAVASGEGCLRYGFEKFLLKEIGDPVYFCPLGVPPGTPGAAE